MSADDVKDMLEAEGRALRSQEMSHAGLDATRREAARLLAARGASAPATTGLYLRFAPVALAAAAAAALMVLVLWPDRPGDDETIARDEVAPAGAAAPAEIPQGVAASVMVQLGDTSQPGLLFPPMPIPWPPPKEETRIGDSQEMLTYDMRQFRRRYAAAQSLDYDDRASSLLGRIQRARFLLQSEMKDIDHRPGPEQGFHRDADRKQGFEKT